MSKASTKAPHAEVSRVKNYITPAGLHRLTDERRFLLTRERPAVTQVVAGVSNGNRSENADYQYGQRRPGRTEQLHILEVRYERIPVEPFIEPPGAEAAPKKARR